MEIDLIIGAAQGRSAIGRFSWGASRKTVAERAGCSVRIVRSGFEKADGGPLEIILGAKNPAEAERIVESVGRRVWPENARIRLIAVDDAVAAGGVSAYCPDGKSIYEAAAESLAAVCLKVSLQIKTGDPTTSFLEEADAWRADAIFIAAGGPNDEGLDSTASTLVTTAKCTLEIVR